MKVIMYPAISLDGFVAYPDGDCEWVNPDDDARYEQAVEDCGCVLVGRKTYEQYKSDFESRPNVMNFVCTTDTNLKDTSHTKYLRGTPEQMIETVKSYGLSEVIIGGGGEANGIFAAAGLVDEIIISIYPLTLGEGIKLFGSYKPNMNLELLSTDEKVKGIVCNRYKVLKDKAP